MSWHAIEAAQATGVARAIEKIDAVYAELQQQKEQLSRIEAMVQALLTQLANVR